MELAQKSAKALHFECTFLHGSQLPEVAQGVARQGGVEHAIEQAFGNVERLDNSRGADTQFVQAFGIAGEALGRWLPERR
ncbi:hypothetical protein D3C81_1680480 [compost metagenome]